MQSDRRQSWSGAWRRWVALPWLDRLLLGEATALLAVATVVIKLVSFRQLGWVAAWPRCDRVAPTERRLAIRRRVRWAVRTAAQWAPWRVKCFQEGLAVQWMLRHRGVPSVLFYGATMLPETGLAAHVWVQDSDGPVIGGEIAHRYVVLARFPEAISQSGPVIDSVVINGQ